VNLVGALVTTAEGPQAMFDSGTHGSGPGEISPDGSSVELYARLPENHAAATVIHQAIPAGAAILELGAGTGRVTHPLLALGHPVVAVDVSAGMLARINGARTVCARIEDLQLDAEFDAVLLMSYLINYGQPEEFLRTCYRHVTRAGVVVLQRETPEFHNTAGPRTWSHDGVDFRMYNVSRPEPDVVMATIEYRIDDATWTHSFTSRRIADESLPGLLGGAGLRFDRFLDEERGWIAARRA
jgi:SAM-dependent methyltransferase